MLPMLAAAGASSALSMIGAKMQNDANSREAQKDRDWQTQMSNTAHQREMADMKAAGLNPMLSGMGGSGASTGSGAQAQQGNILEGAASSARDAFSNFLATKQQQQTVEMNDLQKEAVQNQIKVNTWNSKSQQDLQAQQINNLREENVRQGLSNQSTMAGRKDSLKALELGAKKAKMDAETDVKYQGMDQFNRRAQESMAPVGTAFGIYSKMKGGSPGYNESIIHPGTGEVTREREVRYTK